MVSLIFTDKTKGRIKQCTYYSSSIALLFSRVKPNRRFRKSSIRSRRGRLRRDPILTTGIIQRRRRFIST